MTSGALGESARGPNVVALSAELLRRGRALPTVAQIAFTGEDALLTVSYANLAGAIQVQGRFLDAESGQIIPFNYSVPQQAAVTQNSIFRIGTGYLLGANFSFANANGVLNGAPPFGQIYVMRGTSAVNFQTLQLIAQGYGGVQLQTSFPFAPLVLPSAGAGWHQFHNGTTPAAGNEIREVVPIYTEWRPVSFHFQFVTSAAVGNRTVYLVIQSPSGVTRLYLPSFVAQAPSTALRYQFIVGGVSIVPGAGVVAESPIPAGLRLFEGDAIGTLTSLLDAGDVYNQVTYLTNEFRDTV